MSPLVLGSMLSVECWSLTCFVTSQEMWKCECGKLSLCLFHDISVQEGAYSMYGKNEQLWYFQTLFSLSLRHPPNLPPNSNIISGSNKTIHGRKIPWMLANCQWGTSENGPGFEKATEKNHRKRGEPYCNIPV